MSTLNALILNAVELGLGGVALSGCTTFSLSSELLVSDSSCTAVETELIIGSYFDSVRGGGAIISGDEGSEKLVDAIGDEGAGSGSSMGACKVVKAEAG